MKINFLFKQQKNDVCLENSALSLHNSKYFEQFAKTMYSIVCFKNPRKSHRLFLCNYKGVLKIKFIFKYRKSNLNNQWYYFHVFKFLIDKINMSK